VKKQNLVKQLTTGASCNEGRERKGRKREGDKCEVERVK